jgi:hypothetical protein
MTNVINHSSNVIRIKKNVFDNIFNMVINVKRKIKGQYESYNGSSFVLWPCMEIYSWLMTGFILQRPKPYLS